MPTHTHYEIQTGYAKDFSVFMKKINLAYFHYFRRKYGWTGHLWQGRFRSQPVGKDSYFLQCGKYIELNPVRKRLTKKPEEWPYSSYRFYANGIESDLITTDFMYLELGNKTKQRQRKYSDLVVERIVEKSYKKLVWGSIAQSYSEKRKMIRKQNSEF
jgi:putative transposase